MAGWRYGGFWKPYVSVSQRRAQAVREAKKLEKKGRKLDPVLIEGRTIASTFWGKSWCENLERYSNFENRLPRGRTYVRNGSVMDLQIEAGRVKALVSGSSIYTVEVKFEEPAKKRWRLIKKACSGKIDSVVELLQGKLSGGVMEVLTGRESGLFPSPDEIEMKCSCPDWADMCKHVAAVLYGVGARLDSRPELLFVLRDVDHNELITEAAAGALVGAPQAGSPAIEEDEISRVFGIELDKAGAAPHSAFGGTAAAARAQRGRRLAAPQKREKRKPGGSRSAGGLGSRLKRLRAHFVEDATLTSGNYRVIFSLAPPIAANELKQLVSNNYLIQRGKKRGTHYVPGVELF